MSLRTRLFLLFGTLIVGLLVAQWMMWRTLTDDLNRELGAVAFTVGREVATFLTSDDLVETTERVQVPSGKVLLLGDEQPRVVDTQTSHWVMDSDGEEEFRTRLKVLKGQNRRIVIKQLKTNDSEDDEQIVTIEHEGDGGVEVTHEVEHETRKMVYHVTLGDADDEPEPDEAEVEIESAEFSLKLDDPGHARNLVVGGDLFDHAIPIPRKGVSETLAEVQNRLLLGSAGILALGLLLAAMAAHRFTVPLRRLSNAASSLGEGQLGLQVPSEKGNGEVGVAIDAFNHMSLRLKELDSEARAMRERESLSELGEIANGLAHTIRNPLNTLGLSVEQLAAIQGERPEVAELAQTARGQIRRIDQWIRGFLALASQGVTRVEALNFKSLIHDVVLEVIQDGTRDVEVDLDLPETLPEVPGVAPEMRAVLQALVVNAVEASPAGGTVTVALAVAEDAANLRLRIVDQGPGIPPAIREKLFSPHVTTKETGSGMGLFLARRIISSRYGGTVQLSDGEAGGTTAEIQIPLREAGTQ